MTVLDHICGFEWPGVTPSRVHRCELRPNHRGDCVCACGRRRNPPPGVTIDTRTDEVHDDLPTAARRFVLDRMADPSGISGLGIVAEGIQFTDLSVALRWHGEFPSTAVWPSIEAVLAVHGHNGLTKVRWID